MEFSIKIPRGRNNAECVDVFFTLTPGKVTADEAYEPIIRAMKVERRSPNMFGS